MQSCRASHPHGPLQPTRTPPGLFAYRYMASNIRSAKISFPFGKLYDILRHMENYQTSLDAAFHALSDPTRRAVIQRLIRNPAPVKALAAPFDMGLPAFLKHLRVLEACGLITTEKTGRIRTCRIQIQQLNKAESWLSEQRKFWQASADRLANYVETHLSQENAHDE